MSEESVRHDPRRWLALGWCAFVVAACLAPALILRDRLPDPMATHFGVNSPPDGSTQLSWAVAMLPLIFTALTGFFALIQWRGEPASGTSGAMLGGIGAMMIGVQAITLYANYDRANWREARPLSWTPFLVIGMAVIALGAAGLLAERRLSPAASPVTTMTAGELELTPQERALWVNRVTNRWLLALGAVLAGVAMTGVVSPGLVPTMDSRWGSGILLAVGVGLLLLSSVGVRADERGVRLAYGLWGWPVQRISLKKIASAEVAILGGARTGWGYRGRPGKGALMVRSGECLLLRYVSGGYFYISVDDAANAAALINAYRNRTPQDTT